MDTTSATLAGNESISAQRAGWLRPVLAGGVAAGALDATAAFIFYGGKMPLIIASGLLGGSALQGGTGTWILGLVLHFFIAVCAAGVYWFASRRLPFLRVNFLVCGLFYGIAVLLFMHMVVLPLSAYPRPIVFTLTGLWRASLIHMFLVGLPIAAAAHFLQPKATR